MILYSIIGPDDPQEQLISLNVEIYLIKSYFFTSPVKTLRVPPICSRISDERGSKLILRPESMLPC